MSEFPNPYICQECGWMLEDKAVEKGESFCPDCKKTIMSVRKMMLADARKDGDPDLIRWVNETFPAPNLRKGSKQ